MPLYASRAIYRHNYMAGAKAIIGEEFAVSEIRHCKLGTATFFTVLCGGRLSRLSAVRLLQDRLNPPTLSPAVDQIS